MMTVTIIVAVILVMRLCAASTENLGQPTCYLLLQASFLALAIMASVVLAGTSIGAVMLTVFRVVTVTWIVLFGASSKNLRQTFRYLLL